MFISIYYINEKKLSDDKICITWELTFTDFVEMFDHIISADDEKISPAVIAAIEFFKYKKINIAANILKLIQHLANESSFPFEEYAEGVFEELELYSKEYKKYKEDCEKYLALL